MLDSLVRQQTRLQQTINLQLKMSLRLLRVEPRHLSSEVWLKLKLPLYNPKLLQLLNKIKINNQRLHFLEWELVQVHLPNKQIKSLNL
jgi:hypothetical protein